MSHPSNDIRSVEVFQHPDQLPAEVQVLFAKAAQDDFQLGVPWYRNLVDTVYADHEGIRIYVLRHAGRPVAALPLLAKKTFLGWELQSLSNYYTSLYAPVIEPELKECDLALLIQAALEAHTPVRSLRFSPMDPESLTYQRLLGAMQMNGLRPFGFFCFGNWYLRVNDDWPGYLKNRTGVLRNTIKRMTKKFSSTGGTLEIVTGGEALTRGLDAYAQVYTASWKKAEPHPKFIPGLMQMCATQGWLRLGVAYLDRNPIAAQIWIVANGKANIYKLAFDDGYRSYAPGTLLTATLMQHVFEVDAVSEVDYLIGDDPYKKSWMSHRRERWGIVAYNPKSIGGQLSLGREVIGRSLKRLITRLGVSMENRQNTNHPGTPHPDGDLRWSFLPGTEFPGISEKWQTLANHSIQSPLLSADFVDVSLRHFGRGDELICIAETQAGPVAATILHRKNGLVWETFQPSQMPLGLWLQLPQLNFSAVMQSLLRDLPLPGMMLGATHLDPQFFPKPPPEALFTFESITTGEIDLPETAADYLKSLPPKPLNRLIRRLKRAEREMGPVTLTTQTAPDDADEFVNLYASIESRSWKGEEGTSLRPNDKQSRFYADLMRRFAATGHARMFTLNIGERQVAAQIAIADNDVLYLLKTTYDPELRSLGPGVMLHYYITLHGYEQPTRIRRIEYYGPLNESQHMWITGSRGIYHANAYRAPLLAKFHGHLIKRRRPISSNTSDLDQC